MTLPEDEDDLESLEDLLQDYPLFEGTTVEKCDALDKAGIILGNLTALQAGTRKLAEK